MYMWTIEKMITTHMATWCSVCTVIESPSTLNTQPNSLVPDRLDAGAFRVEREAGQQQHDQSAA